ncbi:hypothetical protein HZS_7064 [Henneguya salminicola]|nr:hypothetical protein HZS_7064 [Henneguya salminicola]
MTISKKCGQKFGVRIQQTFKPDLLQCFFKMFYWSSFSGNISQLLSSYNTIEKYFNLLCY